MKIIKVSSIFIISFLTVGVVFSAPTLAHETEDEEEISFIEEASSIEETSDIVESTIVGDVDPDEAVTVSAPTIPVDQLELLVKPLTLEELQIEAAAWLLLLKDKVQEISIAEIAIKQENQAIEAEETAAAAVLAAQTQLDKAEKKLKQAKPGTPAYDRASQELEDAKQILQTAQISVEKAKKAFADIQASEVLKQTIQEAEIANDIDSARQSLEAAMNDRDLLIAGSATYQTLTARIDVLDQALINLELVEEDLKATVPGSPDYEALSKARSAARLQVMDAAAKLPGASNPSGAETGDSLTAAFSDATEVLGSAEAETEEASSQPDRLSTEDTKNQLTDVAEDLQASADAQTNLKNQLVVRATERQSDRTAIIDRFTVILDAIEAKGGDTTSYRQYIDAVSGVEIDFTDTEGLGVRVVSWLRSEEGGVRLGIGLAKFVSILAVSIVASRLLAQMTRRVLKHVGGTSFLFRDFAVMLVQRGTLVVGALLATSSLGVSLGPILALVGGASFVLAFALQSNLENFASGIMLLVNKPFDVGDEIKVAGYWAHVDSIALASTRLRDFRGNLITLPNNTVWGSEIINYTHSDIRKLALAIHIKFSQDIEEIQGIWMDLVAAHPLTLNEPAPGVFPWNENYDCYIWVLLSVWVKTDVYWQVHKDLLKALQARLGELGIELEAPQHEL